jgi:putative endonuclease
VYMLASERNGTLYIGVTSDLIKRVWQHREGAADGFTTTHHIKQLVWYEQHETMLSAIAREKAMKKWLRKWKLHTIEKMNPNWIDLWPHIIGESELHSFPPVIPASARVIAVPPPVIPALPPVIPAHAGIQRVRTHHEPPTAQTLSAPLPPASIESAFLDSRIRGNDGVGDQA